MLLLVYWAMTHLEPFQTSKMEVFVKMISSKEITSCLDVGKGSEHASAESKLLGQVLLYIRVYFMFEITCIFCHFSTIRFPFETLDILDLLRP